MIGLDYEGVPCIKITKGDIDPGEEPDSNVGSFLYNSKWPANLRLAGMDFMPRKSSDTLEPSGSNVSTCTKRTYPGSFNRADVWFRNSHFQALAYDLPLAEIKYKDPSSGRFIGVSFNEALHHYDTVTLTYATGNIQHATNGGAVTINAPTAAGVYTIIVEIVNGASAGAITLSGFTKVDGDAFTTTNGSKFQLHVAKTNSAVSATVKALQ